MRWTAFARHVETASTADEAAISVAALRTLRMYDLVRDADASAPIVTAQLRSLTRDLHALESKHPSIEPLTAVASILPLSVKRHDVAMQFVHAALLNYSSVLEEDAEWEMACELLRAVAEDTEADGELALSAQARLRLGFVYRALAKWEYSRASYERAIELAAEDGVFSILLRARIGLANNLAGRGDLAAAGGVLSEALRESRTLCPEITPRVMLAQASVAHSMGRFEDAVTLAYGAFQAEASEQTVQYQALVDVANLLCDVGAQATAREALQLVATRAPERLQRIHALVNLLAISVTMRARDEFDAIRGRLEALRRPPRQDVLFHLHQAMGFRTFKQPQLAAIAARRAAELAEQYSLHHLSFLAEDELKKIENDALLDEDARHHADGDEHEKTIGRCSTSIECIARSIQEFVTANADESATAASDLSSGGDLAPLPLSSPWSRSAFPCLTTSTSRRSLSNRRSPL